MSLTLAKNFVTGVDAQMVIWFPCETNSKSTRTGLIRSGMFLVPKASIFLRSLPRVTLVTQRLKVRLIEEKLRASPMRNDVIHVRRFHKLPLLEAFLTVGMLKNEASAQCLPLAAVSPLRRGPAYLATSYLSSGFRLGFEFGVALCPGLCMGFAVALASRHGLVTAGVGTESQ